MRTFWTRTYQTCLPWSVAMEISTDISSMQCFRKHFLLSRCGRVGAPIRAMSACLKIGLSGESFHLLIVHRLATVIDNSFVCHSVDQLVMLRFVCYCQIATWWPFNITAGMVRTHIALAGIDGSCCESRDCNCQLQTPLLLHACRPPMSLVSSYFNIHAAFP
jgi:hypothetical protein